MVVRVAARLRAGLLAAALTALFAPAAADAQEAPEQATEEADADPAREAFLEGERAARQQRWADSARLFDRAHTLSGAPAALFNRAIALRNLGREREAREAFERVLAAEDVDDATREEARRLRDEADARVAALLLLNLEPTERHEVSVDGVDRHDDVSRPLRLEVDPGEHVVEVRREAHVPYRWRGQVEPGGERSLAVTLDPVPERGPRGWVIALVAVGAAVAAVAVGVGVRQARDEGTQIAPETERVLRIE